MACFERAVLALAGLLGAFGVALAAAGAHITGGSFLPTAAHYLLLHAGVLAAIVALAPHMQASRWALRSAAVLMIIGIVLFSGDLAARALTDRPLLWGTAPAGGTTLIASWLCLGLAAILARRPQA
jgi:uncharacterized membrane protein YgdD (TMEM256/DUF423 family)